MGTRESRLFATLFLCVTLLSIVHAEQLTLDRFSSHFRSAAETELALQDSQVDSESLFQAMLAYSRKMLEEREYNTFIIQAQDAHDIVLMEQFITSDYRFVTTDDDGTVWVTAYLSVNEAQRLESLDSFLTVEPYPSNLKVSPSIFDSLVHVNKNILERQLSDFESKDSVDSFAADSSPIGVKQSSRFHIELAGSILDKGKERLLKTWKSALASKIDTVLHQDSFWDEFNVSESHPLKKKWIELTTEMKTLNCSMSSVSWTLFDQGVMLGDVRSLNADLEKCSLCTGILLLFLSKQPEVQFIQEREPLQLMNENAAWVTQASEEPGVTPIWDRGITGQGQIVAVADTGIDRNSCYFQDGVDVQDANTSQTSEFEQRKVIQYIAFADAQDDEGGHGSHVAGSIAGNSISATDEDDEFKGMAYDALLAFFDIGSTGAASLSVPDNLGSDMLKPAFDVGARIHSNSWGASRNEYSSLDVQIDQFTHRNPEMLVVIAAGNSGESGDGTVATPANAKNALTVGASETPESASDEKLGRVAFFSSRGPSFDGRIKPEVVAPGFFIFSAKAAASGDSCDVHGMAGTSMATPVVSGAAALVRQYFVDGLYHGAPRGFNPSGALVKAMIINSAVPMSLLGSRSGSPTPLDGPPDNAQGFGRIQLNRVLLFDDQKETIYVADQQSVSASQMVSFSLSGLQGQVSVTLVWFEDAGSSSAQRVIRNNLDLDVVLPDETLLFPNGKSSPDTVNTVEKIVFDARGDTATVRVRATSLAPGVSAQPFSLVVTADRVRMNGMKKQETVESDLELPSGSTAAQLGIVGIAQLVLSFLFNE